MKLYGLGMVEVAFSGPYCGDSDVGKLLSSFFLRERLTIQIET
jgi:hypothetical protein